MKHIIWISFAFLSFSCKGKDSIKVLFVGNSLTYYNDMPRTLQRMINEQKLNIKIDQVTPGGWALYQHASFTKDDKGNIRRTAGDEIPPTIKKILSKNWDMVVLQDASAWMLIPQTRQFSCEPAILKLDSVIKKIHGKTVLYQGYTCQKYPISYDFFNDKYGMMFNMVKLYPLDIDSLKNTKKDTSKNVKIFTTKSDNVHSYSMLHDSPVVMIDTSAPVLGEKLYSDSFKNSSEEFQEMKSAYNAIAEKINAGVAEVGYAFELCKKEHPEIPLYQSRDDNHPSKEGSYLIACVFYKYITKKPLKNVKYHADIDSHTAAKLRSLVDTYLL